MIIAANLHGISQRGLELGPVGLAVRAVAPIKDDAGLIGVVEYASDFQALLKQISALTDTQLTTLINEDLWNKARKNDKEFMPARDQVIEGNRTVYSTDWDVTSALVTAEELAPTRGNRTTTRTRGDVEYGVLTMPLMDFSGQQIGFVVATRSFAGLNTEFVDAVRLAVLRMLLGFIVSFGAVIVIFNGLLLRPVTDLLGKLKALEKGEDDTPLAIPGRADEVGELFEAAEGLRLKLRVLADVGARKS
jgi:HAMP domain-containing protein